MVTAPKLGQSQLLPASPCCFFRDRYPAVWGTRYGPTHCSCELQHQDGCSVSCLSQKVWAQGTLINSQVRSEEPLKKPLKHLGFPRRSRSKLFCLSCSLLPGWPCVSWAQVLQTQTTFLCLCSYFWWVWSHPLPTPELLLPAGSFTKQYLLRPSSIHKIINYLIKDHHRKAEFSLWGRAKVTGGDAMR